MNELTVRNDELMSPDEIVDSKYDWDFTIQRDIICLFLTDRQFLLQSMDLVKPSYFPYKAHSTVCSILFDYYKQYTTLPNKHIVFQEIKTRLKGDKALSTYLGEIESLYEYYEAGLDSRAYLSDQILYFAKMMAFREAWQKSMKELDKGNTQESWDKVYKLFQEAFNVDRNFSPGLEYFKTMNERYDRMKELENTDTDKFITGYKSIDEKIKGGAYHRGEMLSVCADSGVGKSLWLTNVACENAKRGYKVCYISMELSEDRIAERFDSMLSTTNINVLYDNKKQVFEKIEYLFREQADKNLIIVKDFPPKSADTNTIRAYINQLKFYGFKPDILIVDYVGEMKLHNKIEAYESLEMLVSELRGLGAEEKMFVMTAMQPNRAAKLAQKEGMIDESHLGNSYGQVRPLDAFISLNQNEFEASLNVGRVYIAKQRFGNSKYTFWIEFNRETLRICEISHDEYKNRMNKGKLKATKELDYDKIHESVEYDPKGSVVDEVGTPT